MRKSILRASAGFQALALMGAGVTAGFIAAAPAAAQDYTQGTLSGAVTNASGAPVAGATVTLKSLGQGFVRTTTTSPSGQFSFSSLPSGDYDVTVKGAGSAPFTATAVQVVPGRTTEIPVALTASTASNTGGIVVLGRRIQAFSSTTTGLNVDVEQVKNTVPVGRNLTSLVLLAPGTARGDTAFGNLASIGGASVAENAYYINGLNITNFDNYLGSAEVPFDFYKTVEVKSGGYPAEFGRATGGIINAISKAGTNDWTAAFHLNWAPEFLRSDAHDLQNCQGAPGALTCVPTTNRHFDYSKSLSASIEAGGPIFRDRLFVYGLLQLNRTRYRNINTIATTAYTYENTSPFWGAKIDAYPIDNQHLELTVFDTRNTLRRFDNTYSQVNGASYDDPHIGSAGSVNDFHGGGVNYVAKYTGRLTDFFTVSAAYGRMRDRFDYNGVAGAGGLPLIQNLSGLTYQGVPNNGYYNGQRLGSVQDPYNIQRKFWRGDLDLTAHFFGDHHFRAGIDQEKNTLNERTIRSGGDYLCAKGFLTATACSFNGGGAGASLFIRAPANPADPLSPYRVEVNYYNSAGTFAGKNQAIYLQDEYRPTDRLTINAGIRRDNFTVNSITGDPYIQLKNNWSPRIGVTYDVFPDKRGKIKAFYGTYYLPIASNTAFRQSGREYYFRERYNISGFDANGLPILGTQITNRAGYQSSCPFLLTPKSSGNFCSVTGRGVVPAGQDAVAANLKATKEAEWIFGYEHKLGQFRLGVNYIRRTLKITSEDSAIDAAALAYCQSKGILNVVNPDTGYTCAEYYTGFAQYVINNPGNPIVVNLPGVQGDPQVTLATKDLGYPKATRKYNAIELTFDKPYDGVWTVGGSYTYSKLKGNSEGFVQSDFGQDDAGITQDFDQPGFVPGSYGYLPNDRRHKLKLYGAYTFWNALTLGTNITVESPRPLSCFGYNPTDVFANVYGAASHYCGLQLSPRGTAQKSDWVKQVDLSARYKMAMANNLTLQFRADVFNVFNGQAIQKRNEIGDLDIATTVAGLPTKVTPNPNYGLPTLYQSPRYVRLGLDVLLGGAAPIVPVAAPIIAPPPPPAAPATITCPDGLVILANQQCPAPPPPPAPPAPAPERGL